MVAQSPLSTSKKLEKSSHMRTVALCGLRARDFERTRQVDDGARWNSDERGLRRSRNVYQDLAQRGLISAFGLACRLQESGCLSIAVLAFGAMMLGLRTSVFLLREVPVRVRYARWKPAGSGQNSTPAIFQYSLKSVVHAEPERCGWSEWYAPTPPHFCPAPNVACRCAFVPRLTKTIT